MTYKLGSLFDGSGGFPLAGFLAGVDACWASEVEPYPIAVTKTRFPMMKHLGDISKINGAEIEPVDIITFGSPCQDLSVAGKRAGLKHASNGDKETTRSGLFMEAVRIIKEMREKTNGKYPRFALWENVPGAFSSNKGEDFRIVLEEIIKIVEPTAVMPEVPKKGWAYADSYVGDGWSLAYRVFDAQYWGVPQRRRRIHLVADFGGRCAREVLFEREGVRGYFEEGGTTWQGIADDAERSVGTTDCVGAPPFTLKIRCGREGGGKGALVQKNLSATIACNNDQYLFQPVCYGICAYNSNSMKSDNPHSGVYVADKAKTLDLNGGNPACNQGGIAIVQGLDAYNQALTGDKSKTLNSAASDADHVPCVVYDARGNGDGKTASTITGDHENRITDYTNIAILTASKASYFMRTEEDLASTLVATDYKDPQIVCYGLDGDKIGKAEREGGSGFGVREDGKMYTLTAKDVHGVVYAVSEAGSIVLDDQGGSQISVRDDGKTPTLRAEAHGNVPCVMEQVEDDSSCVVYAVDQGGGKSSASVSENMSPTLTCTHGGEPAIALDRAFFNQGQNAKYEPQIYVDGTVATLVARGPGAVCYRYIVRRLTPTECARLQGFADRWGDIDIKTDFSDEEYKFWLDVRNSHAAMNGKTTKNYTKKQMLDWYGKLGTDGAEYKMWGNGIALPPALYCMQGIVDALNKK